MLQGLREEAISQEADCPQVLCKRCTGLFLGNPITFGLCKLGVVEISSTNHFQGDMDEKEIEGILNKKRMLTSYGICPQVFSLFMGYV